VGECNISFDAPVGTVALTAGMNGCSLRLYVNASLGILKFCHDNNGNYANDAAYALKGFDHLQSINATAQTRGLLTQNINGYWKAMYNTPGTGVFFISVKSGPSEWKIYKSVVIGNFRTEIIKGGLFSSNKTKFIQTFSGNQGENGLMATVAVPPLALPPPQPTRGRRNSI